MKGIVWLASYPKSGNTWFRIFLANYLRDGPAPVDINDLGGGSIASARIPFDEAVGYDSGEMTDDEVDRLRPEVYLQQAREAQETPFRKVHDAYTFLPDGRPMFPSEATAAAVYIVRNPLDVCVSYAHHGGSDRYGRTVRLMAGPNSCLAPLDATEPDQLRQKLLSWSRHAQSWLEAPGIRVHLMRYEDMKRQPAETFGAAVQFLGLPGDTGRLSKAIEFSRFEELRRQEEAGGFVEKPGAAKAFFRRGEIGSWRETLTPEQGAKIVADHGETMRRFGYLDDKGEPVF